MPNHKQIWSLLSGGGLAPVIPPTPYPNVYSLDFDGVDDLVNVGTYGDIFSSTSHNTKMTYSFWFKTSDTGGLADRFFHTGTGSNGPQAYILSGIITFGVDNTVKSSTSSTYNDGNWHHFLGVYDNTITNTTRIWIDGIADGSNTSVRGAFAFDATKPFDIGDMTGSNFFDGMIDEFAAWESDQSAEVATLSSSPMDLKTLSTPPNVWYRMGDSGTFYPAGASGNWQIPDQMKIDNFSNYSFDFDGVDDTVNCGDLSAYDTGDLSFSVWIYKTTAVRSYIINNQYPNAGNERGFLVIVDPWGGLQVDRRTPTHDASTGFNYPAAFTLNNWHHIVGVYEDTTYTIKLYLDGVLIDTDTGSASTNGFVSGDLYIGSGGGSVHWMVGKIDDISIYNKELSAGEVTTIYNSGVPTDLSGESNLVAYYRMGENSVFSDNSEWQVPNYKKIDNFSNLSCYFDGVDDYVTIYNGASGSGPILFNAGDSFSMSVWVKTSSTAAQNQIISFRGTALIWFYTFVTSGNIRFQMYLRDDSSNTVNISSYNTSSGWITPDAWTNLIFTRNGSTNTMNLYLNGVAAQVPTSDTTSDDFTAYDKLSIGNDNHSGGRYWFDGSMDSVSIWDKELSSGEVTAIYNSGVPTDLSAESNLVGYWRMGEGATWDGSNWTIPDVSTNSNDGLSDAMAVDAVINQAPNNMEQGLSVSMDEVDKINNAPDNTAQGRSVAMDEVDRVEDVPS